MEGGQAGGRRGAAALALVKCCSRPRNANNRASRTSGSASLRRPPCGVTTLLCLLASTTTSLSSFATTDSTFNSSHAHAINILLPPHTRIKAILPRVRAIVSRIVTTTVLARPATILGPHAFAWASTSVPTTRTIAATENASINSRGRNKLVQAGRSIALIGLVDFSGLDRTLGTNTHDQASSGLDPSLP